MDNVVYKVRIEIPDKDNDVKNLVRNKLREIKQIVETNNGKFYWLRTWGNLND